MITIWPPNTTKTKAILMAVAVVVAAAVSVFLFSLLNEPWLSIVMFIALVVGTWVEVRHLSNRR